MIDTNSDPGRPIEMLLKKYGSHTEKETDKGDKYTKEERRLFERLEYTNYVCRELKMNIGHKKRVRHIIVNIEHLSFLCRNCKWETIITAIAFYVRCFYQDDCKINDIYKYNICKENGLTLSRYTTILTRLAGLFQTDEYLSPLCPTERVRRTIRKK